MAAKKATIDDVLNKFESIDRWRAALQDKQDKQHKTLYGNGDGQIGMDERIRNIEKQLGLLLKLAWVVTAGGIGYLTIYILEYFLK